MSNETHANTQNSGSDNGYDVLLKQESRGKTRFYNIGTVWNSSRSDNLVGDTAYGPVIIKPRASKEELDKLRADNAQNQTHRQDESIRY